MTADEHQERLEARYLHWQAMTPIQRELAWQHVRGYFLEQAAAEALAGRPSKAAVYRRMAAD